MIRPAILLAVVLLAGCTQSADLSYRGYDAQLGENPGYEAPVPDGFGCVSRTAIADAICNDDDRDVYCQTGMWIANTKGDTGVVVPCAEAILCPPLNPAQAEHPACLSDDPTIGLEGNVLVEDAIDDIETAD